MIKKLSLGIVSLGLMTIGAFAANNASDNASDRDIFRRNV